MTRPAPPGVTASVAAEAMKRLALGIDTPTNPRWSSVGRPKEKIRIEPVETPVPEKNPAPVEAPTETPTEVPEKVPA